MRCRSVVATCSANWCCVNRSAGTNHGRARLVLVPRSTKWAMRLGRCKIGSPLCFPLMRVPSVRTYLLRGPTTPTVASPLRYVFTLDAIDLANAPVRRTSEADARVTDLVSFNPAVTALRISRLRSVRFKSSSCRIGSTWNFHFASIFNAPPTQVLRHQGCELGKWFRCRRSTSIQSPMSRPHRLASGRVHRA